MFGKEKALKALVALGVSKAARTFMAVSMEPLMRSQTRSSILMVLKLMSFGWGIEQV